MNMEWNTGTPPREGDYLSYGKICPVMVRYHMGRDCWKTSYNSHENWYGITHWMPLPNMQVEKPTAEETLKKAKELATAIKSVRRQANDAESYDSKRYINSIADDATQDLIKLILVNA